MIRELQLADASELHQIIETSLGYTCSMPTFLKNIEKLRSHQHILLVFEENHQILGYCHAQLYETVYFDSLYNIMGLAVKVEAQGQGVGTLLVSELEKIAIQNGITGIRINSGISRSSAHSFYKKQGYIEKDDQKRFFKPLG